MAGQETAHVARGSIPADVPDEREYSSKADAELDRTLVDAIRAAESADNAFLERTLALHLGSHYFETR